MLRPTLRQKMVDAVTNQLNEMPEIDEENRNCETAFPVSIFLMKMIGLNFFEKIKIKRLKRLLFFVHWLSHDDKCKIPN
jgi:hypothetical protein